MHFKFRLGRKLNYVNIFWIVLVHLMAIVAIPFFTWPAFFFCLFGIFFLAPVGINIGYHRMLSHRAFTAPRWFRNTLVTIGSMIGSGPPLIWAAEHRLHHRYSDQELDPHNSRKGFWYSHVTHLFYLKSFEADQAEWSKYVPDLMTDSYLVALNKYWSWTAIATLPILYYFGGLSFVLWGGFVRSLFILHFMWLINSASHMWGYRNYETDDNTRNCWWVALLTAGEGWHNNHHSQPSSAAHGQEWWEVDFSYFLIQILERVGLVSNVKTFTLDKSLAPQDALIKNSSILDY